MGTITETGIAQVSGSQNKLTVWLGTMTEIGIGWVEGSQREISLVAISLWDSACEAAAIASVVVNSQCSHCLDVGARR